MTLRRLLASDASLSVLLHGLKAMVALLVNWLVLRHFAVSDFVTWSVTSSILVVATASDLGIGQYVVTRLINSGVEEWPGHISDSIGALLPLVIAAGAFVLVAINGPSLLYDGVMAILLAVRIVTIPFAAVLNAVNQFKIRKAIELLAYAVAAVAVGIIAFSGIGIHWALVALNTTFLLGAALTVMAAARFVPVSRALRPTSLHRALGVFGRAAPFMANNLTGLITYGGFIWLSSLVLPKADVAKLAVLHGFVLMNLYQLYDVFLKSRQADLARPSRLGPYRLVNLLVMIALPPAFFAVGRQALALIGNPIAIRPAEAALFGVFMAFELGNLFAQSITQVSMGLVPRLKVYSVLRATMIVAFLVVGLLPMQAPFQLSALLAIIAMVSLGTFVYLRRGIQLDPAPVPRPDQPTLTPAGF